MITREEILAQVREAALLRVNSIGRHETEAMLRRTLAQAEQHFGPDSEEAMWALEELARVLHIRAGCGVTDPEGLEYNERAYRIAQQFPGDGQENLAAMMHSLGGALVNLEDSAERGLSLLANALRIVQSQPKLASRESWLAASLSHALMSRGRFAEALPPARRVVASEKPGTLAYLFALMSLGQALMKVGDLLEAEEVLRRAKALADDDGRPRLIHEVENLLTELRGRGG